MAVPKKGSTKKGPPKPQNKSRQVNFRVDPELYERLEEYRGPEDQSQGWVCRKALKEFLERAGK